MGLKPLVTDCISAAKVSGSFDAMMPKQTASCNSLGEPCAAAGRTAASIAGFTRSAAPGRALVFARRRSDFGPVRVFNALRLGNVGECAVELTQAIERDAAVDIGICEVRIVLDRPIEIGDRAVQVANAVREDAPLSIGFCVFR